MDFEGAVQEALAATQRVLGANRKPALPADVHHDYSDKCECGRGTRRHAAVPRAPPFRARHHSARAAAERLRASGPRRAAQPRHGAPFDPCLAS